MNIKNLTKIIAALDDAQYYNKIPSYQIIITNLGVSVIYEIKNCGIVLLTDENQKTTINYFSDKITRAFLSELIENIGDKIE